MQTRNFPQKFTKSKKYSYVSVFVSVFIHTLGSLKMEQMGMIYVNGMHMSFQRHKCSLCPTAPHPTPFWGFCPISWEPDFAQTCGFHRKIEIHNNIFHFRPFPEKTKVKFFEESPKTPFWGHLFFVAKFGQKWIFPKYQAPLFFIWNEIMKWNKSFLN